MKIKSIRYGFANNSSSSHSIVFLGNKTATDNVDGDGFNWEFFTAVSEQSKKEYCLATLLCQRKLFSYIPRTPLTEKAGWLNPFDSRDVIEKYDLKDWEELSKSKYQADIDYAENILKNMKWDFVKENFSDVFGEEMINKWQEIERNDRWGIPGVDHQSVICLPINSDGSIQIDFAKELFSILINKNFAILGGNDNSDMTHELKSSNTASDDPAVMAVIKALNAVGRDGTGPICVFDEENDDFILQDCRMGDKLRLSFRSDKQTKKSSFPELVDLKITDHCDYGCKFCYQSSTKEGVHATLENIENVVKTLASSGTMEIAIGGGEPTTHPNLLKILKDIRSYNMAACFTTKNFNLHEHPEFSEIAETANSIAFSCNSIAEIEKVKIIKEAINELEGINYDSRPKIYIQMIPELMTDLNFDKALRYVSKMWNTPVTLLGYKDFGFGENYAPKNRFSSSEWIKTIKRYSDEENIKFGIDSVLVSKWKNELIENCVDPLALVGEEGKFSCYVDAVKMTIHKSSFSKEAGIVITGQEKTIKEQFATF
jgi:MoaA/NifB/PqqE/SkfB family radical SAM enzyme